jgi:hypothetical protein
VRRRRGRKHKTKPFPNNAYIRWLTEEYRWVVLVSTAPLIFVGEPTNIHGQTDNIGGQSRSNGMTPIFVGSLTQPTNIKLYSSVSKLMNII